MGSYNDDPHPMGYGQPDMTDETSRARLSAIRTALEAAENAMDADAVAQLLSDDAVLIVPDHPVQEGKPACTAFLREMMTWLAGGFHRQITYTSAEVNVVGGIAFDRGTFAFTVSPKEGGASSHVTGKYLWILERSRTDEWILTRLIACRDDDATAVETAEEAMVERAVAVLPGEDLSVARDFYVGRLGFTVQFEATDDGINGIIGLERGTMELTIDCPMSGHGRRACVSLRVDDADAYYREWRHVAEIKAPPQDEVWGGRTFGFEDPFGNTIFVIGPAQAPDGSDR